MKILSSLVVAILFGLYSYAQNFFYIESKNVTEKSIMAELVKASQYVTKSPLASDYIITASATIPSGTHILNLRMTMQDSLTYKTIYQSSEDYTLDAVDAKTRIFLKMTIAGFVEKNICQMIFCARDDHYNVHGQFLKARKDKT